VPLPLSGMVIAPVLEKVAPWAVDTKHIKAMAVMSVAKAGHSSEGLTMLRLLGLFLIFAVKSLLSTILSGYYQQALGRAFIKSVSINIIVISNVCAIIIVPQVLVISCFFTYRCLGSNPYS